MELPQKSERPRMLERLKQWARSCKSDIIALHLAMKHPRTPLYAKILAAVVVGYALSPIDLIPDFIPVLGYIDDVILVPLGIALVIKLLPDEVLQQCREEIRMNPPTFRPKMWIAACAVILVWAAIAYHLWEWLK